jgi:hypothetical protein
VRRETDFDLTAIDIPASVQILGTSCFESSAVECLVIDSGSTLRRIGDNFFQGCKSLVGVGICASMNDVKWNCSCLCVGNDGTRVRSVIESTCTPFFFFFYGIYDVEIVEIPTWIEMMKPFDFCCCWMIEIRFSADCRLHEMHGFQKCLRLRSIDVPRSTEIISKSAFDDCISVQRIGFEDPDKMREIEGFSRCSSIEHIESPPDCWKQISYRAFIHSFIIDMSD